MSELSPLIDAAVATRLLARVDVERKLVRALDALGPVTDRDVLVVDGSPVGLAAGLAQTGARVTLVSCDGAGSGDGPCQLRAADGSADVVVGLHSVYRGIHADEQAEADRVLRPGGRLLVVHDYGRDDVAELLPPDLPEYTAWSRRGGPFFDAGFRLRVIHCWWTFESLEQARDELTAGFGDRGAALAERLRRPRLSYNLAVYHRERSEVSPGDGRASDAPQRERAEAAGRGGGGC